MSAESRESFSSVDSEVMEVTAEVVTKQHGVEMDCNAKLEVNSVQNSNKVNEEKKNNVFDFSSCSDEWQPGQAVNSQEGMKRESVNERGGKKLVFANGSTVEIANESTVEIEKLDRRKFKEKPFPLSGFQVFKQVLYG